MAFSFECADRIDSKVVEGIMKSKFADLTVMGSYEYVDAARPGLASGSLPGNRARWHRLFKARLWPVRPRAEEARHILAWPQRFAARLHAPRGV